MAMMCSKHKEAVTGCIPCHTHPRDVFPDWDKQEAEEEASGLYTCACGFLSYNTTPHCPKCNRVKSWAEEELIAHIDEEIAAHSWCTTFLPDKYRANRMLGSPAEHIDHAYYHQAIE